MMAEEPEKFKEKVQESLRRQVAAINKLSANGMYFFDYGNAFLLESSRQELILWLIIIWISAILLMFRI
jgi:urocanate hydratase